MKDTALSILVTEDEPAHSEAIRRSLHAANPNAMINIVVTLREFLEFVAAHPPDIAIMDINLPDGRAIEILTSPPEDSPFPVVVMTGYGNEQIAVEAMKAGALDYIVKSPEVFADMSRIVERVLREWKLLQGRKQAEEALKCLASTDDLTKVYNRRVFMKIAGDEMNRFRRYQTPFTFIMIDMDNLKSVNDLYGHSAGDHVLKDFAQAIFAQIREVDILGRLGGDEFGVLLVDTKLADGRMAAVRIREALCKNEIELLSGEVLKVTASMGLSEVMKEDTSLDSVVSRADAALYEAKDLGRDRIAVRMYTTAEENTDHQSHRAEGRQSWYTPNILTEVSDV